MKQVNSVRRYGRVNRLEGKKVTYKELAENIGKQGVLTVPLNKETLHLPVTIVNARRVFDRLDYQVSFDGQLAWASAYNVAINQAEGFNHE